MIRPAAAILLVGVALARVSAASQENDLVGAKVSYVSGLTAYLTAGREKGIAPGDSAWVVRGRNGGTFLVITAVSRTSSSARALGDTLLVGVGDSVVVKTTVTAPAPSEEGAADALRMAPTAADGTATGSVALQIVGAELSGAGWTFIQPALLLRLNVLDLPFGMTFSLHGRSTYELGPDLGRFPLGRRHGFRVYSMSVTSDDPSSWLGVGFGRLVSRHVGGLGAFDGAQVIVRQGRFAAGVLAGFQPDYVTSGLSGDRPKFAGFVSYRGGEGPVVPVEASVAYGQQRLGGRLDRDFLYLQSMVNLGSRFFLYQSSELDLHQSVNGERTPALRLTNTYISLSSRILDWLGVTVGYDATRPVFLLESMKEIPDTLFDRDLYQGFRGGISFRLPWGIFLMGQGSVRSKPGGSQRAQSMGGSMRVVDVARSGANVGLRYARNIGVYTEGDDIGMDIDRYFGGLSLSIRAGRYAYSQRGLGVRTVATTLGAGVTWVSETGWYLTGSMDRTWDPLRGSNRFLAEAGVHF